jgi:hypothetical protein
MKNITGFNKETKGEARKLHPSLRFPVHTLLATFLVLTLLTGVGSEIALANQGGRSYFWQAYPFSDGTVTDIDRDGEGDWIAGTYQMAFAGFDSFGPGEHRVVYEFDLRNAPRLAGGKAVLSINITGSRYEDIDPNLTLWIAAGNGSVDLNDFGAGEYVATFNVYDIERPPPEWYEAHIDVTKQLRKIMNQGADYVVFVIRANPAESHRQGGYYFSTIGTWPYSVEQFVPARLTLLKEHPQGK